MSNIVGLKEVFERAETTVAPTVSAPKVRSGSYVGVAGLVLWDAQVLLPRQVLPWAQGYDAIYPKHLRYVRQQIHGQVASDGSGQWGKAYTDIIYPDSNVGFTNMYRRQLIDRDLQHVLNCGPWEGLPEDDMQPQMVSHVLPRFYVSVPKEEQRRLLAYTKRGHRSNLRQCFDRKSQEWLWLFELESFSPITLRCSSEEVAALAIKLGSRFLSSTIYVGGTGMSYGNQNLQIPGFPASFADQLQQARMHTDVLNQSDAWRLTVLKMPYRGDCSRAMARMESWLSTPSRRCVRQLKTGLVSEDGF